MTCKDCINIPMQENDAGAKTIGEYFEKLLLTLWKEGESFSGKRPFGNSDWKYDIFTALISEKVIDGKLDEEGYVEDVDYYEAHRVVKEIIKEVFKNKADFVEVVRCKDCIHYGEIGDCDIHPHDGRFNVNYFCGDGERKESE